MADFVGPPRPPPGQPDSDEDHHDDTELHNEVIQKETDLVANSVDDKKQEDAPVGPPRPAPSPKEDEKVAEEPIQVVSEQKEEPEAVNVGPKPVCGPQKRTVGPAIPASRMPPTKRQATENVVPAAQRFTKVNSSKLSFKGAKPSSTYNPDDPDAGDASNALDRRCKKKSDRLCN